MAKLLIRNGHVHKCDLSVIPCENLTRAQAGWESFGGLPWIPTSPNIPTSESAVLYSATGIVGELVTVSIGVGTEAPFGYCGFPQLDVAKFAAALERFGLPGVSFTPATWVPRKGAFRSQLCHGVRVRVTDMATAELCRVNFALLCALRAAAPGVRLFRKIGLFDDVCGTSAVRRAFLGGASERNVWTEFQRGVATFAESRKRYMLY